MEWERLHWQRERREQAEHESLVRELEEAEERSDRAEALREARLAVGLTQPQLAEILGVSQQWVSHMEDRHGDRPIPEERFIEAIGLLQDIADRERPIPDGVALAPRGPYRRFG